MTDRIGVYPGTFDPITNGHRDIIKRALRVVDKIIIGVALNSEKDPIFTNDQRELLIQQEVQMIADELDDQSILNRVSICSFDCLLIDFVRSIGGSLIIRGLRAVSDFEFEFQMASMNGRLAPEIQTIFLTASDRNHFISSRFVKEICRLGGEIDQFVSPHVAKALYKLYPRKHPHLVQMSSKEVKLN
jgi:pantetheine-phosphate adenylyltransferase